MSAPGEIGGYPVHPAAQLFPLMEEAELADLTESVRKGFDPAHPLVLLGGLPDGRNHGQLLDGRNRALACMRADVKPAVREATPAEAADPVAFVMRENFRRRHLTPSQRAAIAAEAQLLVEEDRAKERQRDHGKTAPGRKNTQRPRALSVPSADVDAQVLSGGARRRGSSEDPEDPQRIAGKAAEKVAAIAGVGARSIERAKAVREKAPQLLEQVKKGDLTLRQAEKQIRRTDQLQQIKAYVPPEGEYPVIVADPPWKYDDELDGSDAARGGCPYPPMTVEEICALKVPAAKDSILWLWVTNTVLIEGWHKRVLDAWEFRGKTIYTWDKVDMITGRWGRGQTEHAIIAVRGRPTGMFERERTLFAEKRSRTHSKKPDEFFRLVERTCPATPRLEMFSRQPREGWVTSGAELPPADEKPQEVPLEPCLCGHARARHGFRRPRCKDCECELYEPAAAEVAAPPPDASRGPWTFEWRRKGKGLAHAFGDPLLAGRPSCGVRASGQDVVKDRTKAKLCPDCVESVVTQVQAGRAIDPIGPMALALLGDPPNGKRLAPEAEPLPDQARFFRQALNHYRNGLDLCPWCGVDESRNNPERGGVGWVSGGVRAGQGGDLAICGDCNKKGRPVILVTKKDRDAWMRATRLSIQERWANAKKSEPGAASSKKDERRASPPRADAPGAGGRHVGAPARVPIAFDVRRVTGKPLEGGKGKCRATKYKKSRPTGRCPNAARWRMRLAKPLPAGATSAHVDLCLTHANAASRARKVELA